VPIFPSWTCCRIWQLEIGLHRRDLCDDPQHPHDEAAERDLPRAQWLPVKAALVALPKDQWPKSGSLSERPK
jgi:hypothetical protein